MENNRYREEEKETETVETVKPEEPQENKTYKDYMEDVIQEDSQTVETQNQAENVEPKQEKKRKKNHLYEQNQALKKENAELKDQLLRNLAELENFKKRINEEKIRDRKYALSDFLMELIDVVDIFDQAVNVKTDDEKLQKFLKGFVMVNNSFKQILKRNGVEQIDALGKPFDPTYHSAVETVKVENVEPNMVVEVMITGYTYKDRVLRPSMVKVSE